MSSVTSQDSVTDEAAESRVWIFEQTVGPGAPIRTPFGTVRARVKQLTTGGFAAVGVLEITDARTAKWLRTHGPSFHVFEVQKK